MNKKLLSLALLLILGLMVAGCGSKNEPKENAKTKATGDTITFAYIAAETTSPQPLINQKYDILAKQLQPLHKKVNFVTTRSLDKVWPLMDKKEGSPEFVYIPAANFATYVTKTNRFGGSDKYTIIAGSFNNNGSVIIAKPSIKSLKDLDGKKIGIANNRYIDEYQLVKSLETVGLKTKTDGGTVEVIWDDIVPKLIENWRQGKYDAIILYSAPNYPIAISKVEGSQIISNLNPDNIFGQQAPRYWLIVKKEVLKNEPQLVAEVLKGHVLSTEKALAEKDSLPNINREIYIKYFKDQKVLNDIEKENPLEGFQKRWAPVEITYDPGTKYVEQVFDFMNKRGLCKENKPTDFYTFDPLNEVLKEMNKPTLK